MKTKRLITGILLVVLMIVAVSCSTTVKVNSWAPASSGIQGYKTVAVASTKQYTGYRRLGTTVAVRVNPYDYYVPYDVQTLFSSSDAWLDQSVARLSTQMIEKALNQGVYNIVGGDRTDGLISTARTTGTSVREMLQRNGIELLVTSSVDSMDYNEYVTMEPYRSKDGKVVYTYYLVQEAAVSISVMVQDVDSLNVLWQAQFSDSTGSVNNRYSFKNYVKVGSYDTSTGKYKSSWYSLSKPEQMFKSLLDGFGAQIRDALTPHRISTSFTLMDNKSKIKTLDDAYKMVDDEMYNSALDIFLAEWNSSHYLPAGYNAAIVYLGMGKNEQAVELANEVYKVTGSEDAYELVIRMNNLLVVQDEAIKQITGEKTGQVVTGDLLI